MMRARPTAPTGLTRRQFVNTSAAMIGAAGLAGTDHARAAAPRTLLVLGGTGFIGPHLVRLAVDRGHRVSIFTRGRKTIDLPAVVVVHGRLLPVPAARVDRSRRRSHRGEGRQ